MLVFLHIFHWFRKLTSGITDEEFRNKKLEGFREEFIGRLVRCHTCMGFWVGVFLSLFYESISAQYIEFPSLSYVIFDGILLSGNNFFVWLIARKLGAEEL